MKQNSRQVIISILLLIGISLPLFADIRETNSDSFSIQAGYAEVASIYIEAIPAQSVAYIAGMPFDIEDAMVQFDSEEDGGRRIAKFNILSNTKFKVTFEEGGPMQYYGTPPENSKPTDLHYILYFDCKLGVYENGILEVIESDAFSYHSRNSEKQSWTPNIPEFDGYVGNVDGTIRFMFDSQTSNFIKNQSDDFNLPPGTYSATVTVKIETEGEGV